MVLIMMNITQRQIRGIYNNYNQVTFRKEKWKNKVALQKELGLTEDKGKSL